MGTAYPMLHLISYLRLRTMGMGLLLMLGLKLALVEFGISLVSHVYMHVPQYI